MAFAIFGGLNELVPSLGFPQITNCLKERGLKKTSCEMIVPKLYLFTLGSVRWSQEHPKNCPQQIRGGDANAKTH